MGPDDIEFVVDPSPQPAETTLEPMLGPDRRWRALLAALLVVGGVTWAVTQHTGHSHGVAAPAPGITPTQLPSGGTYTVLPDTGSLVPLAPVESITCKPSRPCRDPGQDVSAIAAAVDQYVHEAVLSSVHTSLTLDHGTSLDISQRTITAQLNSVSLLIRVRPYLHPGDTPTQAISPTPPGLGSALFHYETAAYVVDVQWIGTDSTPPPVDALTALAEDPRLETLS